MYKIEKEDRMVDLKRENLEAYFERLEKLSTEELDQEAQKCVLSEQRSVACVIAHLAEISRREAHLRLGFSSLFDYGVRRLGLSEGSVYLRMQVASVARRFPAILSLLARNRISLSVAGALAPHLIEANSERLLSDCAGKSLREVKEYLVALKPRPVVKAGIQRKRSAPPEGPQCYGERCGTPEAASLLSMPTSARSPEKPSSFIQPAEPEVHNFRFSADKAFKEKLLRAAEVLGIKNPQRNLAEVIERALDITLEKKDPQQKLERRRERERKQREAGSAGAVSAHAENEASPRAHEEATKERPAEVLSPRKRSRWIPSAVREVVLERGGYQCQFRGPDGTRCIQRTCVQVDHIQAFSKQGKSEASNLQILCKAHNLFRAKEEFGAELIRQRISKKG